jgi:hypothetical protein
VLRPERLVEVITILFVAAVARPRMGKMIRYRSTAGKLFRVPDAGIEFDFTVEY